MEEKTLTCGIWKNLVRLTVRNGKIFRMDEENFIQVDAIPLGHPRLFIQPDSAVMYRNSPDTVPKNADAVLEGADAVLRTKNFYEQTRIIPIQYYKIV